MTTTVPKHPAKFSDVIVGSLTEFLELADPAGRLRVMLDPFAGVGGIARLGRWCIAGELEFEWAAQAPPPAVRVQLDATRLPFRTGSVDLWCSSVTYANRLADRYDGRGVCRQCRGAPSTLDGDQCSRCGGAGRDTSSRLTYRIALGRPLHHRNTGALQWGPAYRKLHREAYREALRVLAPGSPLVLNIKDHDRGKVAQGVPAWHDETLHGLGFQRLTGVHLDTKGYGENMHAGTHPELILAYSTPRPPGLTRVSSPATPQEGRQ